jgi:EcoRII C terminal
MQGEEATQLFHCLTIDSSSDDAVLLGDSLSLDPDFVCEIIDPGQRTALLKERQLTFLELVLQAFRKGEIAAFKRKYSAIPDPAVLAARAREKYCQHHRLTSLNPFHLHNPGDSIREISRGVEWELFKDLQLKARSLELLEIIIGQDPNSATVERVIAALINNYQKIDAVLLSASQQRKARAGASFENHIEQLLIDGDIPFEKQVILEAKRRPDFILPSLALFRNTEREKSEVLVLSAKTTLRERWKQVQSEIQNCSLFLATVDENVAGNAIEDMSDLGIILVVPEKLRKSEFTDYARHTNVIDFKTFFETEVRDSRMMKWNSKG